jgi:hypothetical protein
MQIDPHQVFLHPACKAARLDNHIEGSCTVKVFVGGDGGYLVRPIRSLVQEGWVKRYHSQRVTNLALRGNAQAGDPDITPSIGSGVFLEMPAGDTRFFSNDHVLCNGRWELEKQRVSDWPFDIASIEPGLLALQSGDSPVPKARIASEDVTNASLHEMQVDLYGIGGDLFSFSGRPFAIDFTIPSLGEKFGQRKIFGLRLPDRAVHHPAEIAGMSGSPVTLSGQGGVVGLVVRVHQVSLESQVATIILFVGPDELRDLTRAVPVGK